MTKEQIIQTFDPSQPGLADATIFGLPFSSEQSEIIIIPVPWEVTVSYGAGASEGPEAVLDASFQVDLNHQDFPELWKLGMYYAEIPDAWKPLNNPPIKTLYVQPGHYLCLGDNSPQSSDGRSWGLVPDNLMMGRAVVIYFPFHRMGRIQ